MFTVIGTKKEAKKARTAIPNEVFDLLQEAVTVLDENYGSQRDYTKVGGYCIIADTKEDLDKVCLYLDYEQRLYEWEEVCGEYIARLYLLGDDFAIVLFMKGETK